MAHHPASPQPAQAPSGFTSNTAHVNGINLHYVTGGRGDPLVLVHGWPQTWFSWHRIMPALAERFTVVAVDLRGAGGSSKPPASAGYDARTMAADIHALVGQLGFRRIRIMGHDIGMLVAYAYAADHRDEVERLVILDGILVGIEPMTTEFQADPRSWVFGLHQTPGLPETLIAGREREYLSSFYDHIGYRPGVIAPAEVDEYVRAYSEPGALSASFEWFRAFPENMRRNRAGTQDKLTMPVLALGGEKTQGHFIVPMIQAVAENVQGGAIPECGHWIAEEAPGYLLQRLDGFLP